MSVPPTPADHAAAVRRAIPTITISTDARTQEKRENAHASVTALVALAARADELERERNEWQQTSRNAGSRVRELERELEAARRNVTRDAQELFDRWDEMNALRVAAEARADLLERTCKKAIRERRSLEVKEDDWHTAYERAEARADELERERNEWLTPFDGSGIEWHESLPNPYTYQASDFSKLVAAVHEYEARAERAKAALRGPR